MLNGLWAGMILFSIVAAFFSGQTAALSSGILAGAAEGARLTLSLLGYLCLWSGIAEITERSGLSQVLKKCLSPVLRLIFPRLPPDSPAFDAIALNVSANLLGLGNAATPLGLRAVAELKKLSPDGERATPDMVKFTVMNTASMEILPTTAAAVRAEAGSQTPFDILTDVWIVSFLSLTAGLVAVRLLTKRTDRAPSDRQKSRSKPSALPLLCVSLPTLAATAALSSSVTTAVGNAALPVCVGAILLYAVVKGTAVFDCFTEGAKNGLRTAFQLLPSLCGLLTAVTALRESGAMDVLIKVLSPIGGRLGIPGTLLPLALMKSLSGGGALSVYRELLKTYGADTPLGRTAALISASSETTFYTITTYFGSVGIKKTGATVPAALLADIVCAVAACRLGMGGSV